VFGVMQEREGVVVAANQQNLAAKRAKAIEHRSTEDRDLADF